MKNKLSYVLLVLLLVVSGCGGKEQPTTNGDKNAPDPIKAGDYRVVVPFKSGARETHIAMSLGASDSDAVGKGMLHYSKEYFSPDTYYVQEGQILTANELQFDRVAGDKKGLLNFKSEENTIGLNPKKGSQLPINDSTTITTGSTIPLIDIYELNFYKSLDEKADIEGISLTLVLSPMVKDEAEVEHTMDQKQLKSFGSETARQLVAHLRTLPEVGNKTPIFVSLYSTASVDASLPGSFLASGYGTDNIDSFRDINEKWLVFPSDDAKKLDAVVSSQFESIRNGLFSIIPTDVPLTAEGKFIDDKLDTLKMTINTSTKTYTEKESIVQQMKELLSNIEDNDIHIVIKIISNKETYGMIQREKGSSDVSVILF